MSVNEIFANSATAGVVLSLGAYFVGLWIKKKGKSGLFNPLLISIAITIALLQLLQVEYEVYYSSAKYLSYLLTPATVSLAIPLYKQWETLKANLAAIAVGILTGVATSAVSVLALSVLFGLTHEQYVTLLPKSVTTAIGMGVSEELGGYAVITMAVIVVTGVLGNMMAETVCRLFHIKSAIAKGLAIGSSSHAMGTVKAMELGEVEGAMSSLSIVVSGLCTVVAAAVFAGLW